MYDDKITEDAYQAEESDREFQESLKGEEIPEEVTDEELALRMEKLPEMTNLLF